MCAFYIPPEHQYFNRFIITFFKSEKFAWFFCRIAFRVCAVIFYNNFFRINENTDSLEYAGTINGVDRIIPGTDGYDCYYYIDDEILVLDNKKIYTIIRFKRGKCGKYNKKELYFGPILLKNGSSLFKDYQKQELEKLYIILKFNIYIKKECDDATINKILCTLRDSEEDYNFTIIKVDNDWYNMLVNSNIYYFWNDNQVIYDFGYETYYDDNNAKHRELIDFTYSNKSDRPDSVVPIIHYRYSYDTIYTFDENGNESEGIDASEYLSNH